MQIRPSASAALLDDPPYGAVRESGEILRAEALSKTFLSGAEKITPLASIDLTVKRGEMVAVVGPSGTGKSTLLHILAALDTPTSGEVYFGGESIRSLGEAELAAYRNRTVGFVWQRHHLLPDFTAAENVALPLLIRGESLDRALRVAKERLSEAGLAGRVGQRASELSGGEQQRVAMARALVTHPALLLADEPTGDLDERTAENILDLMQRLHRFHHLTSILATHNVSLARQADRVLILEHGRLVPAGSVPASGAATITERPGSGTMTPGERG
jgi:lipoprotein-releasing system ATP-binding protein